MGLLQDQAGLWRKLFEVESNNQEDSDQCKLQLALIAEEYKEVTQAYAEYKKDGKSTHAPLLKELGDLVFVCYQAAENMGWDLDETMQRIFESNISKLDGNGNPIRGDNGKILKGPSYQPPDLSDLV